MKKKNQFYVIEFSDKVTKICVNTGTINQPTKVDHYLIENHPDVVVDGTIVDSEQVIKMLRSHILSNQLDKIKDVYFVYSSTKTILREINLPPVNPKQIQTLIETNASEYFPIDTSTYYFSYSILEKLEEPQPAYRTLVTAIPKPAIKGFFDVATALGLNIKSIDTETNAQYCLLRDRVKENNIAMYFNIGQSTSIATFMHGDRLLMQRTLPFGGEDLINAVLEATDEEQPEGRSAYLTSLIQINEKELLKELLSPDNLDLALSRVLSGIDRSVNLYYALPSSQVLNYIVLTGSYANVPELKSAVEDMFELDCYSVGDLEDFTLDIIDSVHCGMFFTCTGATIEPLDFTTDDFIKSKQKKQNEKDSIRPGVMVLVACTIFGLVSAGFSTFNYIESKKELEKMENELVEYQYVVDLYNEYVSYDTAKKEVESFELLSDNHNSQLVALLTEFEQKMPASIGTVSAICDLNGVVLNVTVKDFEAATVALDELNTFETIKLVNLSTIEESENDLGVMEVAFSVTCEYVQEEVVVEEAEVPTVIEPVE